MNSINLTPVPFTTISKSSDFKQAKMAWLRNCDKMHIKSTSPYILDDYQIQAYQNICQSYLSLLIELNHEISDEQFYLFLKSKFDLFQVTTPDKDQGLLTGYFEPDLNVSSHKSNNYPYPIYARPRDLVVIENAGILNPSAHGIRVAGRYEQGTLVPYATHAEILNNGLEAQAEVIAWCNNYTDLFFAHIQGSARLNYDDGHIQHICYDGTNGHRYTTIGCYMVEQGWLKLADVSMKTIKTWLNENPDYLIQVLTQNKSYIFFKTSPFTEGPAGAFDTVLTPEASIAIDPLFVPLGCLMWLDADHPTSNDQRLQQLVLAQDIGGMIKGPLRADFYWGSGDQAGNNAGVMKSQAKFYLLLPKS